MARACASIENLNQFYIFRGFRIKTSSRSFSFFFLGRDRPRKFRAIGRDLLPSLLNCAYYWEEHFTSGFVDCVWPPHTLRMRRNCVHKDRSCCSVSALRAGRNKGKDHRCNKVAGHLISDRREDNALDNVGRMEWKRERQRKEREREMNVKRPR